MQMQIEKIPPHKIAYMRHTGPYGAANLQTIQALKSWAQANGLLGAHCVVLGIAQDNPHTTKPEHCRYDACMVLPDEATVNDSCVAIGNLAGGDYAIFTICHTAEAMQTAWAEIFTQLHELGHCLDETRPILERYKAEMVSNHLCEICLPML